MKAILTFAICISCCLGIYSQNLNPKYDSTLAKAVGADRYGMKMYVLVILKTGKVTIDNKTTRDSLFAGHLNNIKRLADQKQLYVAGPFGKNDSDFRGLFILNVRTKDEAYKLLETDPAVKAELLKPELYLWYGSAALGEYLDASEKVGKFTM